MTPHRAPRPPPAPQHTSKSGCLRARGHAGLVSAQPGPTVPRRPHFQPLQGRGSPQSLTPSPPLPDPHPQGDHSSPHTSALPGPGPSPKKRKKIHGTHRLRPCSSPHSASHTLRAAQARVAVRKWSGARLGARGRAACTARWSPWIPRQTLIGRSAGHTLFPGSRRLRDHNSLGGT